MWAKIREPETYTALMSGLMKPAPLEWILFSHKNWITSHLGSGYFSVGAQWEASRMQGVLPPCRGEQRIGTGQDKETLSVSPMDIWYLQLRMDFPACCILYRQALKLQNLPFEESIERCLLSGRSLSLQGWVPNCRLTLACFTAVHLLCGALVSTWVVLSSNQAPPFCT